jgi:tetratricopeptide (TPR) repeat protein
VQTNNLSRVLIAIVVTVFMGSACSRDTQATKRRYVQSGDEYVAQGKFAEAVVEYRNALKMDARDGDTRYKLAGTLIKAGTPNLAYGEYLRAADLLPTNVEAQVSAGNMCLIAGQFEDAKSHADRALALNPTNVSAQILRGNALAGLKDFDAAIAQVQDAIKGDPNRIGSYADLGALQMAGGNAERAEQSFKDAIAVAPRSPEAHAAIANFYWATGRTADAEKSLREALALDPDNLDIHRALSYMYVTLGRIKDAEAPLKFVADHTKDLNAQFLLADYYAQSGRAPEALKILEALEAEPKMYSAAMSRKAVVLYQLGKGAEADAALDQVLAKDAKNNAALEARAALLADRKMYDQALQSAQKAVAADPQSVSANFLIGRIQTLRGDSAAAMTAYNDALKLSPKYVAAQLELAKLELAANRPDEALRLAQAALVNRPRSAQATLIQSTAYLSKGNAAAAESGLKVLATTFPNSAAIQAELGRLYLIKRDESAARAAFDRALKADSGNLQALTGLVTLDVAQKKLAAAGARMDTAVAQHPNNPDLMLLAARTYNTMSDPARAERTVRAAIKADPSSIESYRFLGKLYFTQHRLDEALAEFTEFTKRDPKSVSAHTMVGILLELQSKRQEAAKRYQTALDIDANAAIAANNLAMIYVDSGGNLDQALALAQTAKSQLPDHPDINDTLGWIYVKKSLGSLAVPLLQQSVTKDPKNPDYEYHLGVAYASIGDRTKARASFERALSLDSNFDAASEARKALADLKSRS